MRLEDNNGIILIDFDKFSYNKKDYFQIVLYHKKSKSLVKCWVLQSQDLEDFLIDSTFDDVSDHCFLKISRDGKLKLDFKL